MPRKFQTDENNNNSNPERPIHKDPAFRSKSDPPPMFQVPHVSRTQQGPVPRVNGGQFSNSHKPSLIQYDRSRSVPPNESDLQTQGTFSKAFNQLQRRYRSMRGDDRQDHGPLPVGPISGSNECCCNRTRFQSKLDLSPTSLPVYNKKLSDMERQLALKDEELKQVRETMGKNESAILGNLEEMRKEFELKNAAMESYFEEKIKRWAAKYDDQQKLLNELKQENSDLKIIVSKLKAADRVDMNCGHVVKVSDEMPMNSRSVSNLYSRPQLRGGNNCDRFTSVGSTHDVINSVDTIGEERSLMGKREWRSVEEFLSQDSQMEGLDYLDNKPMFAADNLRIEQNRQFRDDRWVKPHRRHREVMTLDESEKIERGKGEHPHSTSLLNPSSRDGFNSARREGEMSQENNIFKLKSDLLALQNELNICRNKYQTEKETWTDEKNKVIAYQKTLQEQYLKTFNLCKELEKKNLRLTDELRRSALS